MKVINYLVKNFHFNETSLINFINSAPYRYKVYSIPKNNNKGTRIIAQPTKELKFLQLIVVNEFLSSLPVHKSAMAYKKGYGIKSNVQSHASNKYFLKMDFKDFFPSIKPNDLIKHINLYMQNDFEKDDIDIFKSLFFYKPRRKYGSILSIGAPSSPFISNTIMYKFDKKINSICKNNNITYTRYADDLTFSTNTKSILFNYPTVVENLLSEIGYPNLLINTSKTVFLSHKFNIRITGLVITDDGKVSIGRKKKRYIKSLIFKFLNNQLISDDLKYLKGYISFCNDVEPSFIGTLEKKYGRKIIEIIKRK